MVQQFVAVADEYQDRVMRASALHHLASLKAMVRDPEALRLFDSNRMLLEDLGLVVTLGFDAYRVFLPFDQIDETEALLRQSATALLRKDAIAVRASVMVRLADVLYAKGGLQNRRRRSTRLAARRAMTTSTS